MKMLYKVRAVSSRANLQRVPINLENRQKAKKKKEKEKVKKNPSTFGGLF